MEHILKSWSNFFRFIIGIIIIFLFLNIIVQKVSENTEFNVDYSTDKTLITIIDKKNVIASSVLPACDCWVNTGIEIRPDEEFVIKVSGKIHTTMDKMVKDADEDVMPRFPWIGPDGDNNFRIREDKKYKLTDSLRKTLLLSQKAKLGQVIFFIQKNSIKPNCNLVENTFLPDSIEPYDVNKGLIGKNDSKVVWYIWASVNDMLLRDFSSEVNHLAYLGGVSGDTLMRKQLQWKQLTQQKYNRIWFDDNFGDFVISAKITKPSHFWKIL